MRLHGVEEAWLPPIGDSTGAFGGLAGRPLHGLLVDQTASLAGHGCLTGHGQGDVRHRHLPAAERG